MTNTYPNQRERSAVQINPAPASVRWRGFGALVAVFVAVPALETMAIEGTAT